MKIQISTKDVERVERTWEGQTRVSFQQWALLSQGSFVLSFLVSHQAEHDAYEPGDYEFDPTSFSTKNGRLTVERPRLMRAVTQRSASVQSQAAK